MNIFNPDFSDFIAALNTADVKYMLVGGYAVIIHGYNRTTGDLDIWVERSEENYEKLLQAFRIFGMSVFDMSKINFLENEAMDVFTFGRPPVSIDLMVALKGLVFSSTYLKSQIKFIEGLEVRLLSIESLIEAKKLSGRNKDLDDIEHLL
ncbi:MAG: hypothetical protein M3R25_08820 [Bacteroidota bacterium]|nr:hypothetical protein [Bacteroidota bacterium]